VTYSRCLQDAKFALSNPTSILFVFLEKNLGCLSFLEWLQRFLLYLVGLERNHPKQRSSSMVIVFQKHGSTIDQKFVLPANSDETLNHLIGND
jgi:hypothetical protein